MRADGSVFDEHDGGDETAVENALHAYVDIMRRRVQWVILGIVFGLAAGVTWTIATPAPGSGTRYYKATATLVADDTRQSRTPINGLPYGLPTVQSALPTAERYAQSMHLTNAVAKKFGVPPGTVVERLNADLTSTGAYPALAITALATDPSTAVTMADSAAKIIIDHTASDAAETLAQLQDSVRNLEQQRDTLDGQIAQDPENRASLERRLGDVNSQIQQVNTQILTNAKAASTPTVGVQQPARAIRINKKGFDYRVGQNVNAQSSLRTPVQEAKDPPKFDETDLSVGWPPAKPLRIPFGLIAGLIVGSALALLAEAWDDRVRRREDVERVTGLPVLAEIARLPPGQIRRGLLIEQAGQQGPTLERFRSIRSALQLVLDSPDVAGHSTPVVLITSPGPSEGKSIVAANLAATFAEGGTTTLAIDGDYRRPALHRRLDPVSDPEFPDRPMDTPVEGLSYLAGPRSERHPYVAIDAVEGLIDTWRASFGLVVVDTPPILSTNDAADLLGVADVVVLVVRAGQTRRRQARRVVSQLRRLKADVAGVVVNGCDRAVADDYYDYHYQASPSDERPARRSKVAPVE